MFYDHAETKRKSKLIYIQRTQNHVNEGAVKDKYRTKEEAVKKLITVYAVTLHGLENELMTVSL